MKAISTIIATIILVVIAISLVGTAYLFVSGLLTGQTSKSIKLMEASGHIVIIQNMGTQNITSNDIRVLVNGGPRDIINPQTIKPGDAAALKFIPPNFGNEVISANVIVVGPSNSLNYRIDFIPHEPRVTSGTVGLWHFNGDAEDETGVNDGTINGATLTTDCKFGSCLSFDGNNDNVQVPHSNSLVMTTGLTMEAWIKVSDFQQYRRILQKSPILDYSILLHPGLGNVYSSVNIGGTEVPSPSSGLLSLNTWYHVAVTYDNSMLRFYLNGVEQGTGNSASGNIANNAGTLGIGANPSLGDYFNGTIDEVAIYNRALSQEEILDSIYG